MLLLERIRYFSPMHEGIAIIWLVVSLIGFATCSRHIGAADARTERWLAVLMLIWPIVALYVALGAIFAGCLTVHASVMSTRRK